MQPAEPHFAVVDGREGVIKRCFALAQRLDFRALQHDAGFPGVQDVVVMPSFPVGRQNPGVAQLLLFTLLGHKEDQSTTCARRSEAPPAPQSRR